MTVKELIQFLEKQPQNMQVVREMYSEQILLTTDDISIGEYCLPRDDGWVQSKRPDKESEKYLVFAGN